MNFKKLRNYILGSEFNSSKKINALKQINSKKTISDYFELKSDNVSKLRNVLSYDLTHTIGNFLHDIEVSSFIEGQRKKAKTGDFIISRLRSYLKEFAVVVDRKYEQVFSSEYLVFRPKTRQLNSSVLVAFCLTKQVQTILNCSQYGTAHPRFYEFVFNEIPIPEVLLQLNTTIEILFKKAFNCRNQSKQSYTQAETLLLQEIGLAPLLSNDTVISLEKYLQEKFNPTIDDVLKSNSSTKPDALDKINFLKEELEKINHLKKDAYYQKILEKEQLISELDTTFTSLESELNFEKKLLDLIKKHNQNVKNTKEIQKAAKENINIKSFATSFGTSGRLDAEYYQPKYEKIENAIKTYKNGFETLDAFIKNFSTGYPYKSKSYIKKDGIPLIRINNIKKGHLSLDNAIQIPKKDLDLSPKDVAVENDILISMSGTIGNTCKIPKGIKAVVNQRIMKITPQNYNFEVLPLVINSIIGELQLNRIGTGGVQTNISSTDIRKILIPKIVEEKQQQIANLIEESFALKKQSEQLLEVAKKAVEIAIEESEEVALEYISQWCN